jgi:hypothetical protein
MALQEKYIVLCDEVRQELNGKYILLGVYTPDMAVGQLPIVVPALTFFVVMMDDRPDQHQFRLSLQHLETGQVIAQGMGGFQTHRPGMVAIPIRVGPIQFAGAGAYTFSLRIDDAREPITHSFNILLNITPQQQTAPGGGMLGGPRLGAD